MKLIDALELIKRMDKVSVNTQDVAVILNIELTHASKILQRLASAGHLIKLKRGLWAINDHIEPMALFERLTSPYPSYISLQTALYHHGMISQIPSVYYGVSLARTQRITTPIATYSIHHMTPDLFFGYDSTGILGIKMATPEKALFDFFYFSRTKSRLFARLPEIEIPENFKMELMMSYINKIKPIRIRSMVTMALSKIITNDTYDDK